MVGSDSHIIIRLVNLFTKCGRWIPAEDPERRRKGRWLRFYSQSSIAASYSRVSYIICALVLVSRRPMAGWKRRQRKGVLLDPELRRAVTRAIFILGIKLHELLNNGSSFPGPRHRARTSFLKKPSSASSKVICFHPSALKQLLKNSAQISACADQGVLKKKKARAKVAADDEM